VKAGVENEYEGSRNHLLLLVHAEVEVIDLTSDLPEREGERARERDRNRMQQRKSRRVRARQ